MTGFVLLRVRAHRLLLGAALLAVLLTTTVLATLAGFSGSIGDAALRAGLRGPSAPAATLRVSGQITDANRAAADAAVRDGARRTFDGLPATVRSLERSGPYALPRTLQPPAARTGDPDLTHFAALDRSRITLVRGAWPTAARTGGTVEAALPEEAATRLRVTPGTVLALTDRFTDKPLRARITGLYRPVDTADPYWLLDPAGGRGVKTVSFTTYGPLLTDPAVLASPSVSEGETSWLGSADFSGLTTDRIDALRTAATEGPATLAADTRFGTTVSVTTGLPTLLDQTERALAVSRTTLLIVAVQLVLLAAYALLLVARLLSTERSGETALLRARGGSRRRIAGLAAVEALLLALPAALAAPLLAGPLTRLLAERSALASLGVRLDTTASAGVWLVSAGVALCCAAAVVAPALATRDGDAVSLRKGRSGTLPAPVRAGADLGLLAIAGVAFWQLQRQPLAGDGTGGAGVDPVLVAAPALALFAGTVLTLRLLPPAARLAERRAAGGRGLSAALAGWQFSRRPLRGAGPVLLLVLAVAMGMLAIGQSASWERSQRDQADFRAGTDIRVLGTGSSAPAQTGRLAALPGVRSVAPAHRATMDVAGRTATVLALDARSAAGGLLLREDLAGVPAAGLLGALAPEGDRPGLPVPGGSRSLVLGLTATAPPGTPAGRVSVLLEDPHGVLYREPVGTLPADGRSHRLTLDLRPLTAGVRGGGFVLAGIELTGRFDDGRPRKQSLRVDALATVAADGAPRPADPARTLARWSATSEQTYMTDPQEPVPVRGAAGPAAPGGGPTPFTVPYALEAPTDKGLPPMAEEYGLRLTAPVPNRSDHLRGAATEAFMAASGAERGDLVEVSIGGRRFDVAVERVLPELPTTGTGAQAAGAQAPTATPQDGGAVLVDLAAVNRSLALDPTLTVTPTEWWLTTAPGRAAEVAKTLRSRPDADPAQVVVRDEIAADLLGDPLGAGPNAALMAVAAAAAALAAVGFAVGSAGSVRERSAEFDLLRALGAPRRRLARLLAAEQGVLIGVGLLVGLALGAVLARTVVPVVVLTSRATRPIPSVLVELPLGQVALLLAGVAALPLAVVAAIALRRTDPAVTLRHQGDH